MGHMHIDMVDRGFLFPLAPRTHKKSKRRPSMSQDVLWKPQNRPVCGVVAVRGLRSLGAAGLSERLLVLQAADAHCEGQRASRASASGFLAERPNGNMFGFLRVPLFRLV